MSTINVRKFIYFQFYICHLIKKTSLDIFCLNFFLDTLKYYTKFYKLLSVSALGLIESLYE